MIRQCGFAVKAGRGSGGSCFGMRGLNDESEPLCVDIMMGEEEEGLENHSN